MCDFHSDEYINCLITGAFSVECDMTSEDMTVTIVHHSEEARQYVHGYESSGSYILPITYVDANAKKLRTLMADSDRCEQFFMWECRGALIFQFSYYLTSDGEEDKQVVFVDEEAEARGECGCLLDRACREENTTT